MALSDFNLDACDTSFELRQALLIYSGREGTVVTQHRVDAGKIMPGEALDIAAFNELLKVSEKSDKKNVSILRWRHPRLLADHPSWHIWWAPSGVRSIFVNGKPRKAWFPTLVFAGHRKVAQLYCWAVMDAVPSQKSDAFRPKFGPKDSLNHIFDNSSVCLGSTPTHDKSAEGWEKGFFDTNFKTGDNLPPEPYEIQKAWGFKKLGPLGPLIETTLASK